jgi:hypothetical protein
MARKACNAFDFRDAFGWDFIPCRDRARADPALAGDLGAEAAMGSQKVHTVHGGYANH